MLANVSKIITMLSVLSGLLGLIPQIKALVQQIEESGLSGVEKKESVLKIITGGIPALETAFGIQLPDDLIKDWAGSIIDTIVAIENLIGNFTHKAAATQG
jgi:hypothetical protein